MISKELYDDRMRKAIMFTGHNLKTEAVNVIYDEIKANFTNDDFHRAIGDIMELEIYRLNGPSLMKRLKYHRTMRYEREAENRKEQDRLESRKLWESSEGMKATCSHRKCKTCNFFHVRCDVIAKATIEGMKALFSDQINHKDMMSALHKAFPEAGFDKKWKLGSDRQYVTMEELRTGKLRDLNSEKLTTQQIQAKYEAEYYGDEFVREQA